jgi:AraC-like DNA-binding protein
MSAPLANTDTALSSDPVRADPGERISRAEAAARLGVSGTTLTRYFQLGTLTPIRTTVGRRTYVLAADVERVRRARLGLDQ